MAFSDSFIPNITRQIIIGEGEKLTAYRCTAGKLTVGIGHNCEAKPVQGVSKVGDTISREQSRQLFTEDITAAIEQVQKSFPWVTNLNEPRQAVLYDMAFNMGLGGLKTFTQTMRLIQDGNFGQAAANIMASKYARDVRSDGYGGRFDRVERLMTQLIKGQWVFERDE